MGTALLVIFGPLLGLACYAAGPAAVVAVAVVSIKPWWATPILGALGVSLATVLFTPVCGLCSSPLPMPLPWLLAAFVDKSAATNQALIENGKVLLGIYSLALLLTLSLRGIRHVLSKRSSDDVSQSSGG